MDVRHQLPTGSYVGSVGKFHGEWNVGLSGLMAASTAFPGS